MQCCVAHLHGEPVVQVKEAHLQHTCGTAVIKQVLSKQLECGCSAASCTCTCAAKPQLQWNGHIHSITTQHRGGSAVCVIGMMQNTCSFCETLFVRMRQTYSNACP
jgi:hypothetical protein